VTYDGSAWRRLTAIEAAGEVSIPRLPPPDDTAGWELLVRGATMPIGTVIQRASRQLLQGDYVLADGRALARADYPEAWAFVEQEIALGNPDWTAGDGSTTFTVPNYVGRFLQPTDKLSSSSTSTAALQGAKGGVQQVTLTVAQMPPHAHPIATDAQSNNTGNNNNVTHRGSSYTHTSTTLNVGSGQSHENMPPWVAVPIYVRVR